ncbi:MAG: hypothetical protein JW940_07485 [Polyangiaceae bacterium]|nr:hypothetical protein [Polyangiaceae bacterium]
MARLTSGSPDILDLQTGVPSAQRHIDAAGLGERVRVGDLRTDSFGSGPLAGPAALMIARSP